MCDIKEYQLTNNQLTNNQLNNNQLTNNQLNNNQPNNNQPNNNELINQLQLTNPPLHDNAYVWLLMKGDSYLPGIFTSVYSIVRTTPDADLVVMVTPDVGSSAIATLSLIATHIVQVKYLQFVK